MRLSLVVLLLLMAGCTSLPQGIEPVRDFALERYLGEWYEVARLDHAFERGLSHVTASYTMRSDGGVRVINRGYKAETGRWQSVEGKAYFVAGREQGYLKVAFFGPFYGAYVIFELDQDGYQYALISGPTRAYLWLLARTPNPAPEVVEMLLAKAAERGFDTSRLIFTRH